MKVLITGANGFIGKRVVRALIQSGIETVCHSSYDGDIVSPDWFDKLDIANIKHCIHLAGKVFVPRSWENPQQFYLVNVMGTENVLEFCRMHHIHMIYVSSYVYESSKMLPISEDFPLRAVNPYAHSKLLAESLCKFYTENFNVKSTIVRPFNVYGYGQNQLFLIPNIINQAITQNYIEVLNIDTRRDYIYVDDLARALISTLSCESMFEIYNVGSGISYSVAEIIEKVQNILGSNKEVRCKNVERCNEISDVRADCSKIKKNLGFSPSFTFEQGLTQTIKQFQKNLKI